MGKEKGFFNLEFIISLGCVALMIGMGYFFLSLGATGAIDFGEHAYLNKLIWFFGSISLISCKAFFLGLKSIKHKLVAFFISFMCLLLGFTLTGGVTFDAADISIGITAKLISHAVIYCAIAVVIVFIVISIFWSDTPTQFLKTIMKSGVSVGIIALVGIFVIPALPF